jgi:hypothetical protein
MNPTSVFSTTYIIWLMLGKVSGIWHAAFTGLNNSDNLHETDEKCALLGYYVMSSGNFLPTVWENLSIPSSMVKNKKKNLDPWRWEQYVVPKCWCKINTTRCVIPQKTAVLILNGIIKIFKTLHTKITEN